MPATSWARHPWKLPVLSGVLLAISYFTFWLPVLNFLAFLPLLAWIDANLDGDWKVWRKGGFAFGLTVNVLILHWMISMLAMSFLAIPCWLGLAAIFAVATTVAVMVLAWARRTTGWGFWFLLPVCWLPIEWAQAQGDLRMTAQQMAHTLAGAPFLIQFDDLLGPYGVGAFMLIGNGLAYAVWSRRKTTWKTPLAALVVLFALVLSYDTWCWTHPPVPKRMLRVAFVQPNIPLLTKMDPNSDDDQARVLDRLTRKAAQSHPDVIVWPETARPKPLIFEPAKPDTWVMPDVSLLAQDTRATIVTGSEFAVYRGPNDYEVYNAVMVVHPDGTLDQAWTAKTYLVPFVESIPFRFALGPLLSRFKGGPLRWLAGGFTPGPHAQTLPILDVRSGATVCFEELYFDLNRELRNAGASIQFVTTNHAWFRNTIFQWYAKNTVRMRAIENRSSFVRAANTGISGFVDPLGRWYEQTRLFTEDLRVMDLPIVEGRTVYDRVGDVVAYLAIVLLGVTVWAGRRKIRGQRPE